MQQAATLRALAFVRRLPASRAAHHHHHPLGMSRPALAPPPQTHAQEYGRVEPPRPTPTRRSAWPGTLPARTTRPPARAAPTAPQCALPPRASTAPTRASPWLAPCWSRSRRSSPGSHVWGDRGLGLSSFGRGLRLAAARYQKTGFWSDVCHLLTARWWCPHPCRRRR